MNQVPTWMAGLLLATIVALLARGARALSTTGAVAAIAIGTLAVAAGWSWAALLIAYFVGATLLSRHRAADKAVRTGGRVDKGGPRDAMQVLANGGVFALCALGYRLSPDPLWQALGAAALGASAADTWSTEVGTLAGRAPRSILDWRPVEVGSSGGVSTLGLVAGVAGATMTAAVTLAVGWPAVAAVAALIGGTFGCVLDSVVGASLQARRWCASCESATEQRVHRCGTATVVTGGLRWLDNDAVNAISTIGGALFGATGARYFF